MQEKEGAMPSSAGFRGTPLPRAREALRSIARAGCARMRLYSAGVRAFAANSETPQPTQESLQDR